MMESDTEGVSDEGCSEIHGDTLRPSQPDRIVKIGGITKWILLVLCFGIFIGGSTLGAVSYRLGLRDGYEVGYATGKLDAVPAEHIIISMADLEQLQTDPDIFRTCQVNP